MEDCIIERIDELQYRLWVGKSDYFSSPSCSGIPWTWILSETLELVEKYSSGVSEAVLLSHLQCKWDKFKIKPLKSDPLFFGVTDLRSLLQGNSLRIPLSAVLILHISGIEKIPSTSISTVILCDSKREYEITWYFPSRFQKLSKEFLINRTVRMTGCKLVNSFLYGNRMLPTDYTIFEISESLDSDFIESKQISTLKDINPEKEQSPLWIFTKVVKISSIKRTTAGVGKKSLEIKLEDQNQNILPLILYGEQVSLSYLIKKLDILIIQDPVVPNINEWKTKSHLKYGTNTIIYIVNQLNTSESNQNILLSRYNFRVSIPQEQELVKHRILLSDIKQNTRKISFLATCVDIGPSNPIEIHGNILDRRLVTCGDESMEKFYITTWDGISKQATTLRPGHLLFFNNLTTTPITNGRFFTNCWEANNSKLYNLTLMPGIIQTPFFNRYLTKPPNIKLNLSSFLCRATITGYISQYNNSTLAPVSNSYHSICYRPLKVGNQLNETPTASPLHCSFCNSQVPSNQITSIFKIKWKLKDISGIKIIAEALPNIDEQLIEITAFEFQTLSLDKRNEILNACLYKELIMWISITSNKSNKLYRIDQICEIKI